MTQIKRVGRLVASYPNIDAKGGSSTVFASEKNDTNHPSVSNAPVERGSR